MVCEAETGRVVWEEWLGDPLMSQPAIAMGKLFIAYPAHQRKPRFVSSMTVAEKREAIDDAKKFLRPERFRHQMLCADLMTGEHLWERDITADVITAPVVHGDQLFFTCMDGTSFCLDASDGRVVWQKQDAGTSAPLVWGRHVFKMHKDSQDQSIEEALKRTPRGSGEGLEESPMFSRLSPYRHTAYGGGSGVKHSHAAHLDAGVGFAVGPAAAKLDVASAHLGVSTVSGAWAYQGSRPARGKHGICNAQGNTVYCVTEDDASATKWRAEVKGATVNPDDQIFLPPALGRESIYLTSMLGHIVSLHQETGAVGILYSTDRPISFQPTLAAGSVFVGTSDGLLLCINTGSPDADGWYMWGGNAQHNLTCEAE
jgi:outer membrane protein assembly factor BamB